MSTHAPEQQAQLPDYVWERKGRASGPRAGFWRRFWALVIDSIIVTVAVVALTAAIGAIGAIVAVLLSYVYYTVMEGGRSGQTLGKKALGIRVVDANTGGSIGYGRALVRNLARILSSIPFSLGYLWMLWDGEKQTWHDKLASDHVVPAEAYPVR